MRQKILASMSLLVLVTILLSSFLVSLVMYRHSFADLKQDIQDLSAYLVAGLNLDGVEYLALVADIADTHRITLVAADGTVLFDSQVPVETMENHRGRPEISAALQRGEGEATRFSDTLNTQTYYYARCLENGQVLRVASTSGSVYSALSRSVPSMLLVAAVTFLLARFLARWQTKRIVAPINALDLKNPLRTDVYDELSPLVTRIVKQNVQISQQISELQEKREEFLAITENIREGLVVLNAKAVIMSMNQSALRIFRVKGRDYLNRPILTLYRGVEMQVALEKAYRGVSGEAALAIAGRQYQLMANPVWVDRKVRGVVLLILDVTEKMGAEQMRREFSANVSHELKTPLTSISGYAEIMMNGLVKPQDVTKVAEKIYMEARHLIALVEDIIKLSRLDENVELSREEVDLLQVAREVAAKLQPLAEERDVTISITGDSATVHGLRHTIEAMLFNLCENAIKYNREKGRVDVSVYHTLNEVVVEVADTGIGIPYEHQERVFERFYRVDKSHSKSTGGTGLGLSIVKRGALYHDAKVQLTSEPGEGTTVTLRFPKNS